MGFFNSACYVGGSAVIVVSMMGGIEVGSKLPPQPNTPSAEEAGGTPGLTSTSTGMGYNPANLPSGTGPTPWMDSASQYLGFKETGNNRGSQVDQWNTTYGGSIGDPWCATFVNATLAQNGIQGTGSAWSRSFMNWGTDAGGPVTGSVVVFKWNANQGHVGYVHSVNPNGTINVLGGNQSQGVSIATYSTDKVIGYRLPPGQSGGGVNVGGGSYDSGGGVDDTR